MGAERSSRASQSARRKEELRAKSASREESKMTEADSAIARHLAFTIDTQTGDIVKLERLDSNGARHELSESEKAQLVRARDAGVIGLEEFLEQAFEAGIACVLGDDDSPDLASETEADTELRRVLLTPLMESSHARRLLRREVLGRAILGTLIKHAMQSGATSSGKRAAH
jgi:hypothetical protein